MTRLVRMLCAGLVAMAAHGLPVAYAQAPAGPPGPPGPLDDAARQAVVASAAEALRERYVYPDVGEEAAAAIEAELAAGRYDDLEAAGAFAQRLTTDLQDVTKDKHLRVVAPGSAPVEPDADSGAPPQPPPRNEGGVTRADLLADDIGYIEVVAFPPPPVFKPVVDRAMAPLADTRALVIDARRNGGGSPVSVAYLVSYFLEAGAEPVKINEFNWRNPGTDTYRTDEFMSTPTPYSYTGKPVYVLTSGYTFSGGEELAYDMQVMELGETVGETTGGGANPVGPAPLASGLMLVVPGGYAQNPITGTNWEGVGVAPDIATPVEDALKVALTELGVSTDETEIGALSQTRVFEPRSTAHPDSEAAVRRMTDELVRGEPNYDLLSEGLAQATRDQLPDLHGMFADLGEIESVTFVEVGPMGFDVYDVELTEGAVTWRVMIGTDGKTQSALVRPKAETPSSP